MTFRDACAFVVRLHRHHKPPVGSKFQVAVVDGAGIMRGVAIAGRPVARAYDDGFTLEVNRTCTDGCPNANSCLYAAVNRVAAAMGYRRVITYTQAGESGASLRGAGWMRVKDLPARGSWKESSVKLAHIRDSVGSGGVARTLWEAQVG